MYNSYAIPTKMCSTRICVGVSITFDWDDRSESMTTVCRIGLASVSIIVLEDIIQDLLRSASRAEPRVFERRREIIDKERNRKAQNDIIRFH